MLARVIKQFLIKPTEGIQEAVQKPSGEDTQVSKAYRFYQEGNWQEGERLLCEILESRPKNVDALCLLGEISHRQKRFQDSSSYYRKAIVVDPQFFPALSGLGLALYELGDLDQAYNHLEEARRLKPKDARNLNYLGLVLMKMGNLTSSRARLKQAVQFDPGLAEAWNNLGIVYRQLGNMGHALLSFKRCVEKDPNFSLGVMNYGLALRDCERIDEAERLLREAVRLRPGNATTLLNLAVILQDQAEFQESHSLLQEAIRLRPELVEAHTSLGALLQKVGDYEGARISFERAIAIEPDYREARSGLGELQLLLGDFEAGWEGYEARLSGWDSPKRHYPYPEWNGENLDGKTLLVYAEQGLGDIIMFSSCLPDIIAKSGHCVIDCYPRLEKLIKRSFPAATVHGGGRNDSSDWLGAVPKIDYQVAIGSLPRFLRRAAQSFPAHQGYLKPDHEAELEWRKRLAQLGPGLKIGIAWQGGLARTGRQIRSLPLKEWAPLLGMSGVEWISLQYTKCEQEIELLRSKTGITVHHWQDAIDDIDQTAALIASLDLVITVCSTLVHMTGALGKPVWVLVPASPGWRYLAEGEALPWYPSARMFRQSRNGDWSQVLSSMTDCLLELSPK